MFMHYKFLWQKFSMVLIFSFSDIIYVLLSLSSQYHFKLECFILGQNFMRLLLALHYFNGNFISVITVSRI